MFDPTDEETAISPSPFRATMTEVIRSGIDVPAAKKVSPITYAKISLLHGVLYYILFNLGREVLLRKRQYRREHKPWKAIYERYPTWDLFKCSNTQENIVFFLKSAINERDYFTELDDLK